MKNLFIVLIFSVLALSNIYHISSYEYPEVKLPIDAVFSATTTFVKAYYYTSGSAVIYDKRNGISIFPYNTPVRL